MTALEELNATAPKAYVPRAASEPPPRLGRFACKHCKHTNLEWYTSRAGKKLLATPFPGTTTPNRKLTHFCAIKAQQNQRHKIPA